METTPQPAHMKKTLIAGSLGNVLEWYDFALFGYFAPILAKLFFPSQNPTAGLLSTFGVFAAGFLMRPIGAAIFGHFGDKVGRKNALAASVILMAIPTTLVGSLPTYDQVGIMAPVLLTLLRLVQGVSVGGELTGSLSFLVEHAPPGRRGFFGSLTICSGGAGILLGSAVGALVTSLVPDGSLISWGWRIPFLLGILVGGIGLYMRMGMEEPPTFRALQAAGGISEAPIREAVTNHWREMLTIVGAIWVYAVSFYMIFVYMTTYLSNETHIPLSTALELNTITMLVLIVLIPCMGALSDRIGRKPLLLVGSGAIALLSYPLFLVLSHGHVLGDLGAQLCFAVIIAMVQGTFPVVIVELFPTRVRMTAVSLAYNVGLAIFGGTTPLIATYLITQTGSKVAPSLYLLLTAVVSLLVFLRLRETYRGPLP